jgi:hypothetical protein
MGSVCGSALSVAWKAAAVLDSAPQVGVLVSPRGGMHQLSRQPSDLLLEALAHRVVGGVAVGGTDAAIDHDLVAADHPAWPRRVRSCPRDQLGARGLERAAQSLPRFGVAGAGVGAEQSPQDRADLGGEGRALAPVRYAPRGDKLIVPRARDFPGEFSKTPRFPGCARRAGAAGEVPGEQRGEPRSGGSSGRFACHYAGFPNGASSLYGSWAE